VAYASPARKEPDLIPYSAIACPHRIMKSLLDREGLIVSRVNLKEIKKFEKIYPNKG